MILLKQYDPMGQAIWDYASHGKAKHPLIVQSNLFEDDEMPIETLFRNEANMPHIERTALNLCKGHILDVGAGAGCHTLALEARGFNVTSIDISSLSSQARTLRGAKHSLCADFFTEKFESKFDTILLLMNGLGIAGKLNNLSALLLRCKELLATGGKILADSSDLRYLFDNDEVLSTNVADYYGEIDFNMVYGNCKGMSFDWLYVDFETLKNVAQACGLEAKKIVDGEHFDYLAEIKEPLPLKRVLQNEIS